MLVNQLPWLEWREFMMAEVTDYIHFKAACVREIDSVRPISDQSYEVDPARNGQDIWAINREMDVVGTSMFTSQAPGDYMLGNYLQDYHRSSAPQKPFFIWELRAGQNAWGLTNWGPLPAAADIARFTWQVIGQGAKLIQYWNWRPHLGGLEVGGHGLVQRDGSSNERLQRLSGIAHSLQRDAGWFLALRVPTARIAIVESARSRILAAGESSDRLIVEAQKGVYGMLKAAGFGVDFISEAQLLSSDLTQYKVLCLPLAYSFPAEFAQPVIRWVEYGGSLFAGAFCGAKDAQGYADTQVPGFGLHTVFGAREVQLEPVFAPEDKQVSNFGEAWDVRITGRPRLVREEFLPGEKSIGANAELSGYRYLSTLAIDVGTHVLARTERGAPAVTWRRNGNGSALLFGSLPIPEDPFKSIGLGELLAQFCRVAGVEPTVEIAGRNGRQIEAKLLTHDAGDCLLVLLNAEEVTNVIRARVCISERRLRSVINIETQKPIAIIEGDWIEMTILPGDAAALRLTHDR